MPTGTTRMLRTADLDYDLPPGLVATTPAPARDAARLLVVRRSDESFIEHARITDLPGFLAPGDALVLNRTRVIPARFEGFRRDTRGRAEGLYLSSLPGPPRRWSILLRSRRQAPGVEIVLTARGSPDPGVLLRLLERSPDEPGAWVADVLGPPHDERDASILRRVGLTPLPPYILHARRAAAQSVPDSLDRERYQTVFAAETPPEGRGSVAAPTAGLHLTTGLLATLAAEGVRRADVTLAVGSGTFKPIETEYVEDHPIHAEWCSAPPQSIQTILDTRSRGRRVIAVGTTAARTIESYAAATPDPAHPPPAIETRLLITPGYRWLWTDSLLTNFHLPRSTLMAMVASMLGSAGRLKALYALAVREGYRFYSYGDAMLILP